MANFKINFKDATCQYVEEYSAGKYGTKVKIYFCEGDAVTPKQYSGSVGTQTITADNIDDLKSKLDRAVSKRDKELEKTLDDSKKNVKDGISMFTNKGSIDGIIENTSAQKMFDKAVDSQEIGLYLSKNGKYLAVIQVDGYYMGDTEDWEYDDEDGFEVNFVITNNNKRIDLKNVEAIDGLAIYNSIGIVPEEDAVEGIQAVLNRFNKKFKDCDLVGSKFRDSSITRMAQTDEQEATLKKIERVAKSLNFFIMFGTTVGKAPQTVILDHRYQDSLIRVSANGSCTIGNTEIGNWRADYCEPETSEIRNAIKNLMTVKDAKFCDASADDIIELFNEAYIKGKKWKWLEERLPSTFLNLRNKHWEELFPVKQERGSGSRFKGVYLTKPKTLREKALEEGNLTKLIEAFEDYINLVNDIEEKYNIGIIDKINQYRVIELIKEAQDKTDSRKTFTDLDIAKDSVRKYADNIYDIVRSISGIEYYSNDTVNKWNNIYEKEGRQGLYNYILKQIDKSWDAGRYKERQKRALVKTPEGRSIEYQRDLVGPLSEEAKEYIRRIMGSSTTEDIDAKRDYRSKNRPDYYSSGLYKGDVLLDYKQEISNLKSLLSDLKEEARKEKALGIDVKPRHRATKYVGYREGDYYENGSYAGYRKGSYELAPGSTPNLVSLNIQGLSDLESALKQVLNSETLDDMEENLQEALNTIKGLPRSNPKVAEIKEKIKSLLEARKNAPKTRVPLPDKKFKDAKYKRLKDGLNNKEMKEFIELCKKLKLETLNDIAEFSKKHGNVQDQKLLEALRKEASK